MFVGLPDLLKSMPPHFLLRIMEVLKIDFSGTLKCGEHFIIEIPARAAANAQHGQVACNSVHLELTNPNNNQATGIPARAIEVCVTIENPKVDCCKDMFKVSYDNKPSYNSTGDLVNLGFNIATTSNTPIQEVRASLVDFEYEQSYQDCYQCINHSDGLGVFPEGMKIKGIGSLVHNKGKLFLNRELTWTAGATSDFSQGVRAFLPVKIPSSLNLPCCSGCIKLCIKFELTDVNCNTCEVVKMYLLFNKKKKQVKPSKTSCDIGISPLKNQACGTCN